MRISRHFVILDVHNPDFIYAYTFEFLPKDFQGLDVGIAKNTVKHFRCRSVT